MKHNFSRLLLLVAVATSLSAIAPAEAKIRSGEKFPAITLLDLDGKKKLDAKELRGKVVVVDFWAQWCEPCKISMPFLNDLAKKYKGKVVVIGINVDEDVKLAKAFLKDNPTPNIRILADTKNEFVKRAGINTMPSSFILDKKGVVKVVHEGFREADKELYKKEIEKLLKAK